MKKLFGILAAFALASAVNADVRIFFSSSADAAGLSDTTHVFDDTDGSGTDDSSYAQFGNPDSAKIPTVDPTKGEFLYVWVKFEGEKNGRKIQGMNLWLNGATNDGQTESDRGIYLGDDQNGGGSKLRWALNSQTFDAVTLVAVDTPGIANGKTDGFLWEGYHNDGKGARLALLGAIKVDAPNGVKQYDVKMGLGKNGVSYASNSDNQRAPKVKFGGNDDENFDGNVRTDGPDYLWSSDADAVVVPEPASMLLIALAGLALRRR